MFDVLDNSYDIILVVFGNSLVSFLRLVEISIGIKIYLVFFGKVINVVLFRLVNNVGFLVSIFFIV